MEGDRRVVGAQNQVEEGAVEVHSQEVEGEGVDPCLGVEEGVEPCPQVEMGEKYLEVEVVEGAEPFLGVVVEGEETYLGVEEGAEPHLQVEVEEGVEQYLGGVEEVEEVDVLIHLVLKVLVHLKQQEVVVVQGDGFPVFFGSCRYRAIPLV